VALHHSISSGKRTNENWFKTLGVDLPKGDVTNGGYKWIEGVPIQVANLAPDQFVTTNKVSYPDTVLFAVQADGAVTTPRPGIQFPESEVYLNHVLQGPRTTLLGLKYTDEKSGRTWMQPTAGWTRPVGQGTLYYFMPGHSVNEFEKPAFGRIILNAVIAK
jgi:type 1 glutamine amidotransferase